MKVVQPIENSVGTVTNSSPAEAPAVTPPIATVSQPANVNTGVVPPVPQTIYPQPQTGMSRAEIEAEAAKEDKKRRVKKLLLVTPLTVIILAAIALGLLYVKNTVLSDFHTVSYTSKGYTYSFKWWKKGNEATLQGLQFYGYKTNDYVVTTVAVPFGSKYSTCTQAPNNQYTQAFTVKVGATTYPVCTNQSQAAYFMIFSGAGHNQLFQLVFVPPPSDPTSVYPALKTIFASLKVSQ
jgi:hypothetical protein